MMDDAGERDDGEWHSWSSAILNVLNNGNMPAADGPQNKFAMMQNQDLMQVGGMMQNGIGRMKGGAPGLGGIGEEVSPVSMGPKGLEKSKLPQVSNITSVDERTKSLNTNAKLLGRGVAERMNWKQAKSNDDAYNTLMGNLSSRDGMDASKLDRSEPLLACGLSREALIHKMMQAYHAAYHQFCNLHGGTEADPMLFEQYKASQDIPSPKGGSESNKGRPGSADQMKRQVRNDIGLDDRFSAKVGGFQKEVGQPRMDAGVRDPSGGTPNFAQATQFQDSLNAVRRKTEKQQQQRQQQQQQAQLVDMFGGASMLQHGDKMEQRRRSRKAGSACENESELSELSSRQLNGMRPGVKRNRPNEHQM